MDSNTEVIPTIKSHNNTHNKTHVLRFNLREDIIEIITQFAKTHQFDNRQTYKEYWDEWVKENVQLLDEETERLHSIGYEGDIKDKMYKAGRYYFKKKITILENKTIDDPTHDPSDPNKTIRKYITMDKTIIELMDTHINDGINECNQTGIKYSPAKGYTNFCNRFNDNLIREQRRINLEHNVDFDFITNKIKKTYKNRYFTISNV